MLDDLAGKRTGERIQILRERRGLSRPVLAGLVGMSASWLKGIERGTRLPPRLPLLVKLAEALAVGDVAVLAGIDMDFRGLPFGPMPTLLAVAEIVDKLQAICVVCGGPASRNQRLVNGRPAVWESPTIMVGGRESYEARCRHCHKVPRADEDQTALL